MGDDLYLFKHMQRLICALILMGTNKEKNSKYLEARSFNFRHSVHFYKELIVCRSSVLIPLQHTRVDTTECMRDIYILKQ